MVWIPKLDNYDVNALITLGNHTFDEFSREQIKLSIVKKIFSFNYSVFYLIAKFKCSDNILREAYAKVIIMKLTEDEYYIDDRVLDEILNLVSLDDLVHYGREAVSIEIREKSARKFDQRGMRIEDKKELYRKMNIGKVRIKKKIRGKWKGDKNDKY